MKKLLIGLMMVLLVGCVNRSIPSLNSAADWHAYGLNQGQQGEPALTVQAFDSSARAEEENQTFYQAYQQGYQQGLDAYCSQSARLLGASEQPYYGVCDDRDYFFYSDYLEGRREGIAGF